MKVPSRTGGGNIAPLLPPEEREAAELGVVVLALLGGGTKEMKGDKRFRNKSSLVRTYLGCLSCVTPEISDHPYSAEMLQKVPHHSPRFPCPLNIMLPGRAVARWKAPVSSFPTAPCMKQLDAI